MIKTGQQFTFDFPLGGVSIAICCGEVEGKYEFVQYIDGGVFPGSLSLTEEDITVKKTFNMTPIDENHPAYIKGWDASTDPTAIFMSSLKEIEEAGGDFFGNLAASLLAKFHAAEKAAKKKSKTTTRRKRLSLTPEEWAIVDKMHASRESGPLEI